MLKQHSASDSNLETNNYRHTLFQTSTTGQPNTNNKGAVTSLLLNWYNSGKYITRINKMNNKKYSVVFMGTPEIGIPSLEKLINDQRFDVVGVFTNPDRPTGRKMIMTPPPVKEFAIEHNIPIFQPERFKDGAISDLESLNPDVVVVIAYGQIIPQKALDIPKFGFVNVHYSLLPKYRGAVPVQMAIKNGEKFTGITIQRMVYDLDAGDIISQKEYEIGENDTTGDLWEKYSKLGANQLLESLPQYLAGEISPVPQNHDDATFCKQSDVAKEKAEINWDNPAQEIHNLVRAFNPWPIAWTTFDDKRVKIISTQVADKCLIAPEKPGTILIIQERLFAVCAHGILEILELQVEGKQKSTGVEFVKGMMGRKDVDFKKIRLGE